MINFGKIEIGRTILACKNNFVSESLFDLILKKYHKMADQVEEEFSVEKVLDKR